MDCIHESDAHAYELFNRLERGVESVFIQKLAYLSSCPFHCYYGYSGVQKGKGHGMVPFSYFFFIVFFYKCKTHLNIMKGDYFIVDFITNNANKKQLVYYSTTTQQRPSKSIYLLQHNIEIILQYNSLIYFSQTQKNTF